MSMLSFLLFLQCSNPKRIPFSLKEEEEKSERTKNVNKLYLFSLSVINYKFRMEKWSMKMSTKMKTPPNNSLASSSKMIRKWRSVKWETEAGSNLSWRPLMLLVFKCECVCLILFRLSPPSVTSLEKRERRTRQRTLRSF